MKSQISKFKDKTVALFKQGLTVKELTLSIVVSTLFSVIPILGCSTIILTTVAFKWKLNLPIMIALCYLLWPVQVALIIPFIRVGEYVFSVPPTMHTIQEIIGSFEANFIKTLSQLSFELLCGLGGWLVTAVPFSIGVYGIMVLWLKIVARNVRS